MNDPLISDANSAEELEMITRIENEILKIIIEDANKQLNTDKLVTYANCIPE